MWGVSSVIFDAAGPGPFGLMFSVVTAVVLLAAWVILAASRLVQGGVVERPERVPQLYGYSVCLIALVWALVSTMSIIENAMSFSAPELRNANEYGFEPSVTSFEAFRATYDRSRRMGMPDTQPLDTVAEPELRRRYEALRADKIERNRFQARRELVLGVISLVIAAGLFVLHWRWLRRLKSAVSA